MLRAATPADIDFIMQTERLPGYEESIGHWSRAQHESEMASASSRYLVLEEAGAPLAFAILQTVDDPEGNIYLKRVAAARQGEGIGGRMMGALLRYVFALPNAHRFHLHFSARNERGRRLYAAAGFREEGVEREVHKLADGSRVDRVLVSILWREWEARAV